MNILTVLKIIAALGTSATGLLALVKPTAVYGFTGLVAEGARGISELRAIFGGLFIALGIAPFIFGEVGYQVLGVGYLADALADEGADEILSIHISNTLSAVVNVAQTAAAEINSVPVTVFDSRQLSLGMGFLVQTAAEMAQAGSSVKEILPVLEDQIKRTHVWAALDTLEFLRRSGRMNGVVSTIGELVQIKPILKMYDGVSGVERVRTRKNAIKRLVDRLQTYGPYEKLAFLHSEALEQVRALQDEVRELLPDKETWVEVINPVLGAHIGPGVVGFACVSKE